VVGVTADEVGETAGETAGEVVVDMTDREALAEVVDTTGCEEDWVEDGASDGVVVIDWVEDGTSDDTVDRVAGVGWVVVGMGWVVGS